LSRMAFEGLRGVGCYDRITYLPRLLLDTRSGYAEREMNWIDGGNMISDRATVRARGTAARSLRLALRQEGEAQRGALAKHFEEFTPSIFHGRSCSLRAM
jgi:hypothetical protein